MSINILTIDTSYEFCSIGLLVNNKIFEKSIICKRNHIKYILPVIDYLFKKACVSLSNLNLLAFSHGPGNFTGIRISTGIILGLSLGSNIPIVGISTLTLLAEKAWRKTKVNNVLTAINAGNGEIYWSKYKRRNGIWLGKNNEGIFKINFISNLIYSLKGYWVTAGNAWKIYPDLYQKKTFKLKLICKNILFFNSKDILNLALSYFKSNKNFININKVKPVYLKNNFV